MMAISEDYQDDILRHRTHGCTLARNLCKNYLYCEYPHTDPVILNGISESKSLGDGTGRAICYVCDTHCEGGSESHKEFTFFARRVALLCDYPLDQRTKAAKSFKVSLWKLLEEFDLCTDFLVNDYDRAFKQRSTTSCSGN
jgi:hypothetical protein